jgi:Beta-glucanase/Beta-glucan synthetase
MANSSLKFLLGLYPKTEQIEQKRNELLKEFDDLNQYAKSDELQRYLTLDKFVNSPEFAERRNYYKSLSYKNSEEEKKEQEYFRLKKSKEIKFYYKYKASSTLANYNSMHESKEITDFEKLKSFVESSEFKKVEEYMKDKKKWEKTEEYKKQQEFEALHKNQDFKDYFKFVGTKGFDDFKKLYKSKEVEEYLALEKYVQSSEFQSLKSSSKKEDFHKSEAYGKYTKFEELKKSSAFKHYFALASNSRFAAFKKIHESAELEYYKELETLVNSAKFKDKKKEIEALRFEQTDEYKKLQEYKTLASSAKIKEYYKTLASANLAEYKNLDGSKLISDYESLEKQILSDEFKNRKAYLLDSKKWEKTDEFKQLGEYESLKKTPKIIWYLKTKDSTKFDELKAWKLAFEDDFTSSDLDRNKWLTRYFWGEVLLHDTYALPGEKHLFTDGKNLEMNGSSVKIVTKSERATGKEWNPMLGFYPKEFAYTSGLISSAGSFRTKYGKIEAKIKLADSQSVLHAFWLAGDAMVPQIDIFKCYQNKLALSTFWGNPTEPTGIKNDTSTVKASKFAENYFIYSLEWSPEKLVWRINNLEVKTQTSNIPDQPLYIVLNSGVLDDQAAVPSKLEIDWVRCYQKV